MAARETADLVYTPCLSPAVFLIDTTLCYGIWSDPLHDAMCAAQVKWLTDELAASTADFVLVGGHYPVCKRASMQAE